jgi:hypothetical protein
MKHIRWLAASGAALLLLAAGCWQAVKVPVPSPPAGGAEAEVDGVAYRVGEPLAHKNITVFVLSSDRQDERDFLTLDEGLKGGLVTIAEQDRSTVGALQIENQGDRPLYLQEGERLLGGKQDRVIASSLVIPPHSGRTTVPAYCVEQSRWVEGERGKEFGFAVNAALAPKGVRGAAKVEGKQDGVWACVGAHKVSAQACPSLQVSNTNSSVNETLDAEAVRSVSDDYAAALASALDGPAGGGAVGLAIAVNGQIEEVNVYPNAALLRKLGPRLIRSYALQATLLADKAGAAAPLTADDVARFLDLGAEKSKRTQSLDGHNDVLVKEREGNTFQCETRYEGQVIHWQAMKKNGTGDAARCAMLGSDW